MVIIMVLKVFLWLLRVSCRELFVCDESQCPTFFLTDEQCEYSCNIAPCSFDYPRPVGDPNKVQNFQDFSPCSNVCLDSGMNNCDGSELGNGICDSDCNNIECGWDLGDCGYCSPGCTIELLTNDICDPICENLPCMFDNNACGWCATGCFEQDLYSDTCIPECNVTACQEYGQNPCFFDCSSGCSQESLGDGACDLECNTADCWYDYGDCLCSPDCTPELYAETTCEGASDPCATEECNFKNGVCGGCALLCTEDMLGNRICDAECNNYECSYDYMDCGCAPGCQSVYDPLLGWTWDTSGSENCLVPACLYNYGLGFSDPFLVRETILSQIIAKNWTLSTLLSHPDCDTSALQDFDAGASCLFSDSCNNIAGMHCTGMVSSTLPACLRNDGKKCLICEAVMVMDICTYLIAECPDGYLSQTEINQLFSPSTLQMCLRDPEVFNPSKYKEYYVDPSDSPLSNGSGTSSDPFMSLYFAFTKIYATFTKILLSAGDYLYQIDTSLVTPLIMNKYDPLNINSMLEYYELWIIGDPISMSVIFWKEKLVISSKAYKTFIQNVIFKGDQILLSNCTGDSDYCYYCPVLTISHSIITTDQGNELTEEDYYNIPTNCSAYNDHILFSFRYSALFENVEFSGFRQQFNSLIYSELSLNLTNVNFTKNQAMAGGSVINLTCTSNCGKASFGYIGGLVTNLNYGYEVTELIEVGSFFSSSNSRSLYFHGIDFTYNFMLSNLNSTLPSHLLGIYSNIGTILIADCKFDINFVNQMIIIDQTKLVYTNLELNALNISTAYSQAHFTLINSVFSNLYSSIDCLTYLMSNVVHNINIISVTMKEVYSGNGVMNIYNSGVLRSIDTGGGSISVLIDQIEYSAYIPPRIIVIDDIKIDSCGSGTSLMQIDGMPILKIRDLTASNIADAYLAQVTSIIVLFSSAGKYLSQIPLSNQIATLCCAGVATFTNYYAIDIKYVEIFSTSCCFNEGPAGIALISPGSTSSIENISIHNVESVSVAANAIFIDCEYSNITLRWVVLENIIN